MKYGCVLLVLSSGLSAAPGVGLSALRRDHVLVLRDVFLNGAGPFRMAIDTGNTSSLIRPEVARCLAARAAYMVEQVTASGSRHVRVVMLDEVRVGGSVDREIEAMVGDVRAEGIDGVLGQSWLVRHDYLLDYRHRRVLLDGDAPGIDVRLPLRSDDGRPMVAVEIDGRRSELVLDSGAPTVVLFQSGRPLRQTAIFFTNSGSGSAESATVRVVLGGTERRMPAVRIHSEESMPGLLPASAFGAVFVSNRAGFVVLVR